MTHAQLLAAIRLLVQARPEVRAAYFPDSRHAWSAGAPDLLIVGARGVLHREVKTEHDDTSGDQDLWLWLLDRAGADQAVWRPGDLESGRIAREIAAIA